MKHEGRADANVTCCNVAALTKLTRDCSLTFDDCQTYGVSAVCVVHAIAWLAVVYVVKHSEHSQGQVPSQLRGRKKVEESLFQLCVMCDSYDGSPWCCYVMIRIDYIQWIDADELLKVMMHQCRCGLAM